MGISQEVYTIYGWEVEPTKDLYRWLDSIDYQVPEGVLLYGMDLTLVMVGPVLFKSGDARWDALEGFESFTQDKAESLLNIWKYDNQKFYTKLQVMCEELKLSPKFYTFVNYS